ncbi:hypothetical protein LTR05_000745 [Lithohypha guttulata]|uniref:Translin-associated protein X n=2 Tax=Lithohypha guttulata TaxID=1690604 RepID=A0AAN7YKP1_9EURO|nr:hypothetical protein LTR05_000745 [Lithohypha guttulata]
MCVLVDAIEEEHYTESKARREDDDWQQTSSIHPMAGVKRNRAEMESKEQEDSPSPYLPMFEHFKSEIDTHHDRRERVIKASRDITAYSKKIIFALQRTKEIGKPLTDRKALTDMTKLKQQIKETFEGVTDDLQGINAHRYQRQISPGIQEFMEAALFEHYLVNQAIMTHSEAATTIPAGITLTYEDYVLGIFDMTGELMKIAITYMATNGKLPGLQGGASVLTDMQTMRTQLELINAGHGPFAKEFEGKLRVTRQSVEKVEISVYSMTVRGKEMPKGWKPDINMRQPVEEIESY